MAKDCLVTKLKGAASNPNLPVYGALYFEHTEATQDARVIILYGNNGDACTVHSDEITEVLGYDNTPHSLPYILGSFSQGSNYTQQFKVKQKGKFYVTSKYDINGVYCVSGSDTKVIGTLKDIVLKIVAPEQDYSIRISGSNVTGDVSELLSEAAIEHLKEIDFQSTQITGTAADLGKFVNATILTALFSGITGSIEDIVNSQIAGGVLTRDGSNPIFSNACLYQFEFNGIKQAISTSYDTSYGHITWESASKIAIYTGNRNIASCDTVWCKGYTQEEAEAKWSGKTILRVDA